MNDIRDILSNARVKYQEAPHARVRVGWVGVDCPKCSPGSNKFRLGFELSTGRSHCWMCGGMYAPEVLAKLLNISIADAHTKLGRQPRQRPKDTEHVGTLKIPTGVGPLLPCHRSYLESRRLQPDRMADIWGVRGIGMALRLAWRLWIPISDVHGRTVSWTTRATHPSVEPRYWAASAEEEEVPHKSILYGGDKVRHTIIVVEGPIDALTIGPGCVATCGVGFTRQQKCLMAAYPVRYVLFDAEDAAQQRARDLCRELALMPGHTENVLLQTGKDPNSADPLEIDGLRRDIFPELEGI